MIISSFFTNNGNPQTGLTPTIRIWEVVGVGSDTLIVNNAPMVETGDGFYKYNFVAYDASKDYVFRTDGGGTLPAGERYQSGTIITAQVEATSITNIAANVWDVPNASHLIPGSTGQNLAQIKADTTFISVSIPTINNLLNTLLKYEKNRTRIDVVAKTLTVYDDDEVTPLTVFNLKDSVGAPSVVDVCERDPI
jgi:hypothetical protein